MTCLFEHNWSWPRKRGQKDIQVCLNCGTEREAKVRFDGPRYRKTQDAIPDFSPSALRIQADAHRPQVLEITSAAA